MASEMTLGKKSVLIAAIIIYLITFLISPTKGKESIISSINELKKLLLPIFAAIFVGTTVKNLIIPNLVSKLLEGGEGLLISGFVGSVLPPCPFVAYPVIRGFREGGTGVPFVLLMLTTATTVEVGQLFCGLVVFGPQIVAVRILFAFSAAIMVGIVFRTVYLHTSFFSEFLSSEF